MTAILAARIAFGVIALVSLLSAIALVSRRNPVATIAWLVVHFVATACAYVLLDSQFLAAVQILVYAGAIMVLFLFVVMLLAIDKAPDPGAASGAGRKVLVAVLALLLVTLFGRVAGTAGLAGAGAAGPEQEDTVQWIADALFSRHLVAFEVSSVLLVAAMAGVLVFTTKRVPRSVADAEAAALDARRRGQA